MDGDDGIGFEYLWWYNFVHLNDSGAGSDEELGLLPVITLLSSGSLADSTTGETDFVLK